MADSLAIYIHWPYCARICPYCDFNIYKNRPDAELAEALIRDLPHWRNLSGPRKIASVHFGGGTPSLMKSTDIAAFLDEVNRLWGIEPDCEIVMEANPDDANRGNWQDLSAIGINRLSLGVQSFDAEVLKKLGRAHSSDQSCKALALAREVFDNISLDLIFGWFGQSVDHLSDELTTALSYVPDHISTYQLTVEPGTAFAKAVLRGQEKAVDPDISAGLYDYISARLKQAGYDHYEVSNFARPGFQSRHNLTYWRGGDYAAIGPGAHGRLTIDGKRHAMINRMRPQDYIRRVKMTGAGYDAAEPLTQTAQAEEYVLMGLRIAEGISLRRFKDIAGTELPELVISDLISEGLLRQKGERISATDQGRLLLNAVIEKLLVTD